ncbi:MAG: 5-oxoprolinase subunit PxpB [Gemmatimonadaceae bacterium]
MTTERLSPIVAPLGDAAVLITLGQAVDRETNARVHACAAAVRAATVPGAIDIVPAYSSFAVHYDARIVEAATISATLREIVGSAIADNYRGDSGRLVTIPVSYDGPDLEAVAAATGLTVEDVISRHSAPSYFVYMMGFSPGFAYLGDLEPALRLPRREKPRTRVPRGSVAIAGSQTAVYPVDTPGGWHLIGRTDLCMFDATRDHPALLRAGDSVRFERIA